MNYTIDHFGVPFFDYIVEDKDKKIKDQAN